MQTKVLRAMHGWCNKMTSGRLALCMVSLMDPTHSHLSIICLFQYERIIVITWYAWWLLWNIAIPCYHCIPLHSTCIRYFSLIGTAVSLIDKLICVHVHCTPSPQVFVFLSVMILESTSEHCSHIQTYSNTGLTFLTDTRLSTLLKYLMLLTLCQRGVISPLLSVLKLKFMMYLIEQCWWLAVLFTSFMNKDCSLCSSSWHLLWIHAHCSWELISTYCCTLIPMGVSTALRFLASLSVGEETLFLCSVFILYYIYSKHYSKHVQNLCN